MTYSRQVLDAAARLNIRPQAVQTYLDAGLGKRAEGVERRFHATIKPIGAACNLACDYCYYLGKGNLLGGAVPMRDEVLERFIVDYIAAQDVDEVVFTWHGGEPLLLGIGFFRKVVELQEKHAPAGRRVCNDIQTNGVLLDEQWGAFLAQHGFLVGLSLDGPRELHDRYRRTSQGGASFENVIRAARLLKAHGVGFSALCTVNRDNARHPVEVYRCLRDQAGARLMQFTPCVEPRDFERLSPSGLPASGRVSADDPRARPGHPDAVVTPWSVDPDDWGDFLVRVFDEWQEHDRGTVKINLFESLLAQQRGEPAVVCSNAAICGKNVALESDGRVYACDHFVYPEHELGRLGTVPLAALVFSLAQLDFGLSKFNTLPSECRSCATLRLCWGECPRTRLLATRPGEGALSYLCRGWKKFFRHRLGALATLARQRSPGP